MMEALEFLNTYKRMCRASSGPNTICNGTCPLYNCYGAYFCNNPLVDCSDDILRDTVETVEEWGKEHPAERNRDKFEKVFGFDLADKFMPTSDIFSWLQKKYEEPSREL